MAATVVTSFSGEQSVQSGFYVEELPAMTVEQWIERVLIGHPEGHLQSILTAIEDEPQPLPVHGDDGR